MYSFLMADEPWNKKTKTVDGKKLIPVAIQKNRRLKRTKKTIYIYLLEGTQTIYYNTARNGVVFRPIARMPQNMKRYYEIFIEKPLTEKEKQWLVLYNYELIN